jgi:hypothetical protein
MEQPQRMTAGLATQDRATDNADDPGSSASSMLAEDLSQLRRGRDPLTFVR